MRLFQAYVILDTCYWLKFTNGYNARLHMQQTARKLPSHAIQRHAATPSHGAVTNAGAMRQCWYTYEGV